MNGSAPFADMAQHVTSTRLLRPKDDEVHVWTALLTEIVPQISAMEGVLSADEKLRAARFLRPEDRHRSIVAHGILRLLLGRYLAVSPESLLFITNAFGKPALVQGAGESQLAFNLAHSGNVILCAMANGGRVGVDVEAIRSDLNLMELAQQQFSPREAKVLQSIGPAGQAEAFFRCWTRKEAYVKARGEGLGFPLQQFSVAFGRDEVPAVLWASDDPLAPERWAMFDLLPAPGYAGAVVVDRRPVRLISRSWVPA